MSRYFDKRGDEKLACPCCGKCDMDEEFLETMDRVRETFGKPIIVTSGYRCAKYNNKIGGMRNSAHVLGKAMDIVVANSHSRILIVKYSLDFGITRIGVGKNFMHLDSGDESTGHPRFVMWHYYK